jgi:hypothetical protein
MDLKDHLDEAAHAGPAHPPVADRLAAGRRAVRRRRLGVATGLAALVAAGGSVWAVVPDQPATVVAGAPDAGQAAAPASPMWPSEDSWAAIDPDGAVTLRPGVEMRQRFDDVVGGDPSVALDLLRGDDHRFVLLWVGDNGVVSEIAEPADGALNEFVVDSQREVNGDLPLAVGTGGDYASLPLVAYRNGQLWVVPGAEIVAAVADPIPGWCSAWPTHAVEIAYQGSRYFAVLTEGNCGGTFGQARADQTIGDFIATFASTQP